SCCKFATGRTRQRKSRDAIPDDPSQVNGLPNTLFVGRDAVLPATLRLMLRIAQFGIQDWRRDEHGSKLKRGLPRLANENAKTFLERRRWPLRRRIRTTKTASSLQPVKKPASCIVRPTKAMDRWARTILGFREAAI